MILWWGVVILCKPEGTCAGIGMFLALIGLQYQEGVGVVTADPSTLVTLGRHLKLPGPCVCAQPFSMMLAIWHCSCCGLSGAGI